MSFGVEKAEEMKSGEYSYAAVLPDGRKDWFLA